MRDHSEESLIEMRKLQEKRNETLCLESRPTKEELAIVECFWNPHFHTIRDWISIHAIVDVESQKLTSLNDSEAACRLICARVKALAAMGYMNDEILIFENGKMSNARLWLTSKGATHFATGVPNILKNPLTFARRHLALFQLLAVGVSILGVLATFAAHALGWF
jgi:hypothetical protein